MSALPAIVNRIPPGLLRSLGLNNTGRNPSQLADSYVPMLELRDWIWTQSETTQQANGAAVAANGLFLTVGANLVVPENEWWFVKSCNAVVAPAAASSCTVTLGWRVRETVAGTNTMVYMSETARVLASENWYLQSPEGGFFVPPGAQPQLVVSVNVGTTAWGVAATVVRLPI